MNYERVGFMLLRWSDHMRAFGTRAAQTAAFQHIQQAYRATGRYYHNLAHIAHVLDTIEQLCDALDVQDRDALRFGGWYHDVVYDPRANDNEERSAELAAAELGRLDVPKAMLDEVRRLIVLTKTHQTDMGDLSGQILLDADLGVLGINPASYDQYAAAIRREYAWVDDVAFREGRARVLTTFLARPHLYHTAAMREQYEAQARQNIARELATLMQ